MFGTFSATTNTKSAQHDPEGSESRSRKKRHQVARACTWCRTYRIKCDASYPCRNCRARGRNCTPDKANEEIRTFPQAMKEINRLKERVKELEDQSNGLSKENKQQNLGNPLNTNSARLPINLDPLAQHGSNRKYYNWDVVSTQTASFNQQTYGPSSSFYFIRHMSSYLNSALQHRLTNIYPACTRPSQNPSSRTTAGGLDGTMTLVQSTHERDLSRPQEESFLVLYWQTYHTSFPVIDEVDFKAHYDSLWDTSKALRRGSALVDIILALCMQYQAALPSPSISTSDTTTPCRFDATKMGDWLHRRGQHLLIDELEEPSILTVQSQLHSVLWLSNAGLHNMAHSMLAGGIRASIVIGLHLEPPKDIPIIQSQFQKRLWWTIYALEMKFAMELGRPLAINFGQVTCSLPSDQGFDLDPTIQHATAFNYQYIKLFLATRAIYITFYRKCGDIIGKSGQNTLYEDPQRLEKCAAFLTSKVGYLQTWLQQVPDTLKHPRKAQSEPYSTDGSELDLTCCPDSVQAKENIKLELLYHKLSMSLYRPFITFTGSRASRGTILESHAMSCVRHAIAITNIIRQSLTQTEYLNGWLETVHWQWNATLSLVGFILAYPAELEAHIARRALNTAILVFESQSSYIPGAATAITVVSELIPKIDLLISRTQSSRLFGSDAIIPTQNMMPDLEVPGNDLIGSELNMRSSSDLLLGLGNAREEMGNTLASPSGFAFTSDSFNGLEDVILDSETIFDFLDFGDDRGL